jgi:hypothetical protein
MATGLGFSTPFGELINPNASAMNAEMADYQALGADWLRTNFWWNEVQPTRNSGYNFNDLDRMVSAADRHGLEVVGELTLTPAWGGIRPEAFADYARATAEHFGDSVNYWEIGNEPNMSMNAGQYTELLKAGYAAIKSVSPDDTVISGGLAPAPETGWGHVGAVDFLREMYANGAKDSMDAVGFHPYSWPLMPTDSAPWNGWQIMEDGIRDTMRANGDGGKQVWMTEFGAPTTAVSQATQAEMLRQAVDLQQQADWAGPLMYYSYQDRGGPGSEASFGLVGPNGAPKAIYDTFQQVASGDIWT